MREELPALLLMKLLLGMRLMLGVMVQRLVNPHLPAGCVRLVDEADDDAAVTRS